MKVSNTNQRKMRFALLGLSLAIFSLFFFAACNSNKSMAIHQKRIHSRTATTSEIEEKEGKGRHKDKDKDKYDGPGEAAEFEYMLTRDPATGIVPRAKLIQAIDKTLQEKRQVEITGRSALTPLVWSERGPYADVVGPSNGNTRANNGITAGRIRAVWVDKSDNTGKTVWVGGVDGGLWKTTDITSTTPDWMLVNDFLSNLAVTGICQDPTNLNTMYFCTGEAYSNADRVNGNGVFKSTDGGGSWTQLSSTTAYTLCSRIECDAAGNVYLGTNLLSTGLLRSKDGGNSWETITPTGLPTRITDFEISSTGRFHVAVGYRQDDGAYRYTDNPSTVTPATWSSPTTPFTYPTGNLSRVELACSGNTLYAVPSNATGVINQIHKSTNGGDTWTTTALTTTNITDLNGSTASSQGWYCIGLGIDQSNDNNVIVGNLRALKTTNGGTTWTKISEWVGTTGQYVHADIHNVTWYDGGNKIIIACDGGIHYSADQGATFRDRNTNLRIKQFYSCAIHPTSTDYFLAGAQDNGTHQLNGSGIASSVEVTGGDGAFVAIDQNEPQYQFAAYVYNQYRRSTNGGATWSSSGLNFSSSLGLFINPWDYDDTNNKLYASYSAGNFLRWDNPTSGTTRFTVNIPDFNGATVSTVKVSPFTSNLVYFGTNAGRIIKIPNANAPAVSVNITGASMPAGAYASCINTGTDDNNLIVCFSNYGVSSIWATTDGGTNWSAIEGNLPDMPIRWVMFLPGNNTKAYAATETGVWETALINGASTVWVPNATFPTVKTTMLKFRASDNAIIASTHGRGLWTSTLPVCGTITVTPTVTNATCNGGSNGKVVVLATGGTGTVTYSISPSVGTQSPSGTFNGLTAQTYTFTATDANGCTGTTTAAVSQPTAIVFGTPSVTNNTCNGGNIGKVVVSATGGTGAITYSISPSVGTQSPSGTFNGLTAQTYTFTATDAAGCTKTTTATVTQPPAIVITPTVTNARCFGESSGTIAISVSGGTGSISYTISQNANTKSVTSPYAGLNAGTYTFTATDANGCVKTQTAVVTQPTQVVVATPVITNASCIGNSDGKVVTSASGGTGAISLGIYPPNGTQSPAGTFTGLTPISYMVIATDANNCVAEKFATVSAGICNAAVYSVSGSARTESNTVVNNITVSAKVNTTVVAADNAVNGTFNITMAPSNDVQIRPAKNNNDDEASGVTTFDITKVSRHFLDIERLETPYKLIAADVDRSGDIDAVDMLLMRRFILRVIPNLPGGNFRFIDRAYNFVNPTNPFAEDFPEVVNFATMNTNSFANFVAVKLGDVNDSYNAVTQRSARTLTFNTEDMPIVAGNEYTVNISADKLDVAAFQGTFNFTGATVKSIKGGNLNNLSNGNFGMFPNAVTTSWNGKAQDSVDVVAITFIANKSGKLSDLLTINSALTQAVANDMAGNEMNINLKFNTDKVAGGEFMLYQNQPNPVATKTTIGFNLPNDAQANLTILTVDGKVVKVFNGQYKAGYNTITVDKSDLQTSGVFYYRLETADHRATKKMIIIE